MVWVKITLPAFFISFGEGEECIAHWGYDWATRHRSKGVRINLQHRRMRTKFQRTGVFVVFLSSMRKMTATARIEHVSLGSAQQRLGHWASGWISISSHLYLLWKWPSKTFCTSCESGHQTSALMASPNHSWGWGTWCTNALKLLHLCGTPLLALSNALCTIHSIAQTDLNISCCQALKTCAAYSTGRFPHIHKTVFI